MLVGSLSLWERVRVRESVLTYRTNPLLDIVPPTSTLGLALLFERKNSHVYTPPRKPAHLFFITRSITLTRPGGIVCVLTSYGTMDKCDKRTRQWIAERAELIAALRLPQGAFEANSGTLCGADLLIFRRT